MEGVPQLDKLKLNKFQGMQPYYNLTLEKQSAPLKEGGVDMKKLSVFLYTTILGNKMYDEFD